MLDQHAATGQKSSATAARIERIERIEQYAARLGLVSTIADLFLRILSKIKPSQDTRVRNYRLRRLGKSDSAKRKSYPQMMLKDLLITRGETFQVIDRRQIFGSAQI